MLCWSLWIKIKDNVITAEMIMMKKYGLSLISAAIALALTGCGKYGETKSGGTRVKESQEISQDVFAMDTYMNVTAYGDGASWAVRRAVEEIERLDAMLSTGDENSEVALLNKNGEGELSSDTAYLLERSFELYQDTDGAFDIAVYPVMEAWGFTTGDYRVPSDEEIQKLLTLTDVSQIDYDEENSRVSFGVPGMKIDFGGIAKGYTSSRIMDIYRECGVESGIINLGGNVQVLGTRTDGSLWRVAIQSPDDEGGMLGVLETRDRAVITSGGYERYFEQDGKSYHHIIDPKTGFPSENGLKSVTIVSGDGTMADGLSTSLFIMGKEEASLYWQSHSDEFDAILLTDEGNLYVTEGIADSFTSDEMEIHVIEKEKTLEK